MNRIAVRWFRAGCWLLIALGLVHLLGHSGLMNAKPENDTERQLFDLMRGYKSNFGGWMRSMFDILAGFSLIFSLLSLTLGLTGLGVARHGANNRPLMRWVTSSYAGGIGVMTAISLAYFFTLPQVMAFCPFACFVVTLALDRPKSA
jgi:hypothetical protein